MNSLDIYTTSHNNRNRYALGCHGSKTLYVIAVNPSTASPKTLDPTVSNVKAFSELLGFNAFIMLNLYPRRSTDPQGLPMRRNIDVYDKNLEIICEHIKAKATIWAAWGDLICIRPYLLASLHKLAQRLPSTCQWIQYDNLTKKGHPRHPARKKHRDCFRPFDLNLYLQRF